MKHLLVTSILATSLLCTPAWAGMDAFHPGTVIPDYGKIADTPEAFSIPIGMQFKVDFDINKPAGPGKINRNMESAARFINIQAANGVNPKNIHVALVIHGKAAFDLTRAAVYQAKYDTKDDNPNAGLIAALLAHNGRVILCGQTAIAFDLKKEDLLPGVEISPSAMTAHAILQAEGYTLNPF